MEKETLSFWLHDWKVQSLKTTPGFKLDGTMPIFDAATAAVLLVESQKGFIYSLELLVKAHRLRWKIAEVPASWYERKKGQSRFCLIKWLPCYLRWYFYGFMTTYFRRSSRTVKLKTLPGNAKK